MDTNTIRQNRDAELLLLHVRFPRDATFAELGRRYGLAPDTVRQAVLRALSAGVDITEATAEREADPTQTGHQPAALASKRRCEAALDSAIMNKFMIGWSRKEIAEHFEVTKNRVKNGIARQGGNRKRDLLIAKWHAHAPREFGAARLAKMFNLKPRRIYAILRNMRDEPLIQKLEAERIARVKAEMESLQCQ